ncbi:MAG: FAD-binding oxidoreductase [Pseudomonadota bacterium]
MQTPNRKSYDVVIIGGAMMGSSVAWFLTDNPEFDGSILVVDRDLSFANTSTSHTNSCMRQQFSTALNVRISQFAADFVNNLREHMGGDERVPELRIQNYGYLYMADTREFAQTLQDMIHVQHANGAATEILTSDQIQERYPFYQVDDLVLGSINTVNEGYWDCQAVLDWWRRSAKERGVETVENEVISMHREGGRITSIALASGETINCGQIVNATGPRAAVSAAMAGIELPVEPRKRFTWIFSAEKPLDRDLPLTIDPSGVHFRQDGPQTYLAGGHLDVDPAVPFDDFTMDHSLWQEHIWPVIATRIPQFEAIKVTSEWAGHYAMNTFDHNAVLGPHDEISNFLFINGFSGHGLQQSPAMGRGLAEWISHGEYRTLDMTPFSHARITRGEPLIEKAVI